MGRGCDCDLQAVVVISWANTPGSSKYMCLDLWHVLDKLLGCRCSICRTGFPLFIPPGSEFARAWSKYQ